MTKLRHRRAKAMKTPRAYFIVHHDARDFERLLPNVKADVDATVTRDDDAEDTYTKALASEENTNNMEAAP